MNKDTYEANKVLLAEGKEFSDLTCIYSEEFLQTKIREMYPRISDSEVTYHSHHLLEHDWLKVSADSDELETCIREQVEAEEI